MKIEDYGDKFSSTFLKSAVKIQSDVRQFSADFLRERGFLEIAPVIISPVTDPLNHPTSHSSIEVNGYKYELTKSMIFHKQISLHVYEKIFAFSPNIRLEEAGKRATGRHLIEFTQLDIEMKNASREEIISLGEDMLIYIIECIIANDSDILSDIKRNLNCPAKTFKRITYKDALENYGNDFENKLSEESLEPFWLIDVPLESREFYDREDPNRPGVLLDMDLIYPEGFGEAISGGEREFELDRIITRISKKGQTLEQFKYYIDFVKRYGLFSSAGFGIGIERLVRFITGTKLIEDVTVFPKVPGEFNPL
jgi:asparaginyl-tRNA synthetase